MRALFPYTRFWWIIDVIALRTHSEVLGLSKFNRCRSWLSHHLVSPSTIGVKADCHSAWSLQIIYAYPSLWYLLKLGFAPSHRIRSFVLLFFFKGIIVFLSLDKDFYENARLNMRVLFLLRRVLYRYVVLIIFPLQPPLPAFTATMLMPASQLWHRLYRR